MALWDDRSRRNALRGDDGNRGVESPRDQQLHPGKTQSPKERRPDALPRRQSYVSYYHGARTHLALDKDAPEPRCVQPPEDGRVIEFPEVGGLHHRYERRAA